MHFPIGVDARELDMVSDYQGKLFNGMTSGGIIDIDDVKPGMSQVQLDGAHGAMRSAKAVQEYDVFTVHGDSCCCGTEDQGTAYKSDDG